MFRVHYETVAHRVSSTRLTDSLSSFTVTIIYLPNNLDQTL
jgi:hypothetical protein